MMCPVCEQKMNYVRETRTKGNIIIRIRECYNEHRYKTEEKVVRVVQKYKVTTVRKSRPMSTLRDRERDDSSGSLKPDAGRKGSVSKSE
jgi:transcriptional regulator NrdR family protein